MHLSERDLRRIDDDYLRTLTPEQARVAAEDDCRPEGRARALRTA
ncbi:hypothetical protein [Thiohalocapsa sp. ML1]|jgi:hypothetical protein|nr:hypothetical protein [Thiohalocapsa sp. ML1]